MSLPYAYTPAIWPSFLTFLLLTVLAVYSMRRRSVPGALPFTFALLFGALWMVGSSLEVAAVDATAKIFWVEFKAAWLLPSATAVTCFLLEYTWPGRFLTRRNLVLLSIPCLLAFVMILTNELHHFVWQESASNGEVIPLNGLGNWIFLVYAYGLGLVNLVVLVWLFIRSPQHRWPVLLMFAGQMGGRVVYALGAAQVIQPNLQIEVIAFWFPISMYVIALFGFRFLNPIPLARQMVIEQLRDGMLVLDLEERVASLNPAAERILGTSLKQAQDKSIIELLPKLPEFNSSLTGAAIHSKSIEMNVGSGAETHFYELNFSPLHDFRGVLVGCLLLLHDMTEQKHAQLQLLEQQQVLATLSERERLARELHDSLGQTLAATHLQASTARLLLAKGETAETDKCLELVAELTIAAEADVREYLLGAKTTFSADLPFLAALRKYVERFSQQYGLQVELCVPARLEAAGLGPAVEVQLLRIIQEALSNVRKHARAKNAQVVFSVSNSRLQIAIDDDGQGFDPVAVAERQAEGFGLQAMRERAEELGGCLEVFSQPGQGTRVVVQLPTQTEEISG